MAEHNIQSSALLVPGPWQPRACWTPPRSLRDPSLRVVSRTPSSRLLPGPLAGPFFSTLSCYTHALAASNVVHMPTPRFISPAGPASHVPDFSVQSLTRHHHLCFSYSHFRHLQIQALLPQGLDPSLGPHILPRLPCSQPTSLTTAPAARHADQALLPAAPPLLPVATSPLNGISVSGWRASEPAVRLICCFWKAFLLSFVSLENVGPGPGGPGTGQSRFSSRQKQDPRGGQTLASDLDHSVPPSLVAAFCSGLSEPRGQVAWSLRMTGPGSRALGCIPAGVAVGWGWGCPSCWKKT